MWTLRQIVFKLPLAQRVHTLLRSRIFRALRRSGPSLKAEAAVSYFRQIRELVWVMLRYQLAGKDYYLFGLWAAPQKARRMTFLSQATHADRLWRLYTSIGIPPVWCKVKFHDFCQAHDLPTVPIISVFQHGKQRKMAGWSSLPCERDVYLKPFEGHSGQNVECWTFDNGSYQRELESFSFDEFEKHLQERSLAKPLILQPRLRNHPDLEHLADGLCTIRLTTSRGRGGRVACIMPSLRIPRGASEVDNFSATGIAAEINVTSGQIGRAFLRRNGIALETPCHPDTGKEIAPLTVPCWDEVRRLCIRAQEACKQEHFIGWDVAITADGPVLLEGNRVFGIDLIQVAHRAGLHTTPFPRHYREHWGE